MNEALALRERPAFDYSRIAVATRGELMASARRLSSLARGVAVDIWEMGAILSEAQKRLSAYGNGTFGLWLEHEVGISRTSAWRMMRVNRSFVRSKLEQTTFASSALYLLSETSTPPQARAEAMRRAENGQAITHATAQTIVSSFTPPKPELPPKPEPPPMPDLPEYRRFEQDELMPRLHDAGMSAAPQVLSGQQEEREHVPEEQKEKARGRVRESVIQAIKETDTDDEEDLEACADEMMEIFAQTGGSIAIAARFGVALAAGPKTLSDLTAIAAWVCGECPSRMERSAYLALRKKTLRLLDSLTLSDGLPVFEHTLANKQRAFGLIEDPPDCP